MDEFGYYVNLYKFSHKMFPKNVCVTCIKMNTGKQSVLFFIFNVTLTYNCLIIIPERASITYVNETYLTNVSVSVRRISRGGDYVANLELVSKLGIGYNVMLDLVFYEYLHNQFKRSFVEMHFKACDLILRDPYVGSIVRKAGLSTCPIPPGKISLKNVCLNTEIPSVWPFEKGKAELTATDVSSGVIMGRGEIVLTFKLK